MTTFTIHFRNDDGWAIRTTDATTPEAALAWAQEYALMADPYADLWLEPYERKAMINEIVVCDSDDDELVSWFDDEVHLRLAAPDILAALEEALVALNASPRFTIRSLGKDSYAIAANAQRAIAAAKGGVA